MRFETKVIHAGEEDAHFAGAVNTPIFQSANFLSTTKDDYHSVRYIRLNNTPNHDVLHKKIAQLEEAEAALVTGSGMGAISTALLAILKPSDHILMQECIYGGTLTFVKNDLKDLDISVTWIDVDKPETWKALLQPRTKAIYVESIANPLTQVGDLNAVVDFAKKYNLVSLIDNTVASPVNYQPIKFGFDLSLHSATKYLNGHCDIVAGAVTGSKEWVLKVKHKLDHLGATLDPHACFLLNRGIKTLALRMQQHQKNALAVAQFLETHKKVKKVFYPGLESHSNHKRARELFKGFSGLLSFEFNGSVEDADQFLAKLRLPLNAASLGGVESLITRPVTTSHSGLAPAARKQIGISDTLIRFSCGIEDTQDLLEDFEQALN